MYISQSLNDDGKFIISKEVPVKFEDDKKVVISEGIQESEYEEVSHFYQKYNRMSTGNITLMTVDDLKRHLILPNISLLMRSANGMLIGTIISILLPVKNRNDITEQIIMHGCTTFLAVHPGLRKMGLCMALIRRLIEIGYERKMYCDYHMVSFPIGSNSIKISSWYRPINMGRSKELGFLYDGFRDPRNSTKVRLKYTTKLQPNHTYIIVGPNNINVSLKYYKSIIKDSKFAFWPNKDLWSQWVTSFPTYLIYKGDKIVGVVSINTVYCVIEKSQEMGRILFPIICNGEMESVMPVVCSIANDLKYDVVYFHEHGSVTEDALGKINAIQTNTKLFFSLYNNQILLNQTDIDVPLL